MMKHSQTYNRKRNEIYSSLKLLYVISQYLSANCPDCFEQNDTLCRIIKISFSSSFIILAYYIYCVNCAIWKLNINFDFEHSIKVVAYALQIVLGGFCVTATFTEKLLYGKLASSWFIELIKIDNRFEDVIQISIPCKRLNILYNGLLFIGLLTLCLEGLLNIFLYYTHNSVFKLYPIVIIIVPMAHSLISILKYSSCLHLIRQRINIINLVTYRIKKYIFHSYTKQQSLQLRSYDLKNHDKILKCCIENFSELLELFESAQKINGLMNVAYILSTMIMTVFNVFASITYAFHEDPIINCLTILVIFMWFIYIHFLILNLVHLASDCMLQVSLFFISKFFSPLKCNSKSNSYFHIILDL